MPIYDYQCQSCGDVIELFLSVQAPAEKVRGCEACGKRSGFTRKMGTPVFVIKGFSEANGYARKDTNE